MVRDRGATPRPDPQFASQEILQLMKGCCKKEPLQRLTFPQIHVMIQILLRDGNIIFTSSPPPPPPPSPAHPADCGGNAAAAIGQVEIAIHLADDEVDAALATENNRVPPPHADYVNVPSSSFLRLPKLQQQLQNKRSVASANSKDEIKERKSSPLPQSQSSLAIITELIEMTEKEREIFV